MWKFVMAALLCTSSCAALDRNGASQPMESWFGLYRDPATLDCLRLYAGAGDEVLVEVLSRRGQQVCEVSERAHGRRWPLVMDDVTLDAGRGIRIEPIDGALTIVVRQLASDGLSPFCGAHATLEGLRFTKAERVSDGACVASANQAH
ncbi:MAG: hypothetical protein GQE15_24120 [Archangiaceae bacterium]|nr:hypothetical protein [Archangiaceae bacterium]